MKRFKQIEADEVQIGKNVSIGENSIIKADKVIIGDDVKIADNVIITCDELDIGNNSSIGPNSSILAPIIKMDEKCRIGNTFSASLNQYFKMGNFSAIGHRVTLAGQGFECGELLWLKNDVILGGGGSQGPDSFLIIGDRSSIFDRSYVNLSERVEIGNDCALSYNVVLLTHGAWQPALDGFSTSFGPISIGDNSVVYLNSVVMPGASIGNNCTVGANATVMTDVPDNSLAVGSPARIAKSSGYPRSLTTEDTQKLILNVLQDYFKTLPSKGAIIDKTFDAITGYGRLSFENLNYTIAFISDNFTSLNSPQSITLGMGLFSESDTHFNIKNMNMSGKSTPIAEDLRDYMRRRAIKFFNGQPFKSLPLSNIQRLRQKRA